MADPQRLTSPLTNAEFITPSADDWLALAEQAIGGRSFDSALVSSLASDIRIEPLYEPGGWQPDASRLLEPGSGDRTRGSGPVATEQGWDIRQRHTLIDPEATNAQILEDLEQGVSSILLRTVGDVTADQLRVALEGVYLDMAAVAFDAGPWVGSALTGMHELYDYLGLADDVRLYSARVDPVAAMARTGDAGSASINLVSAMSAHVGPHVSLVGVDATPWADSGGHEVHELGWSLATAVGYLRDLVDGHGWTIDRAAAAIEFSYAATTDQFATIAKLRAARRCWARIVGAAGGVATGQRQHAVTPESMFTQDDPWVNLLRTSTACFAAAAGGAHSITVLPFDSAIGQPDELARRTSRNIQLLLLEEAHVGQVVDPAGGSFYVETLTDQLAERAWAEFQRVEALGGMVAAMSSGDIAEQLESAVERRRARVATRRTPIIGVSDFADPEQSRLDRDPWPRTPGGGYWRYRPAEPFEALRSQASGSVPTVLLTTLGPEASHAARATWTTNLLESGGLVATRTSDVHAVTEAEEQARASQCRVAVICGTDQDYVSSVPGIARALRSGGITRVLVAGSPGDHRQLWDSAGVDGYIHVGCDVIEVLQAIHDSVGPKGGQAR